jgi:hypothetical protein
MGNRTSLPLDTTSSPLRPSELKLELAFDTKTPTFTPTVRALCTPRRGNAPQRYERAAHAPTRRRSTGLFDITSPRTIMAPSRVKTRFRLGRKKSKAEHDKPLVERVLASMKRYPRRHVHLLPFHMPSHSSWMHTLDTIALLLFDQGTPTLYRIRYDLYKPTHKENVYFVEFYVSLKSV